MRMRLAALGVAGLLLAGLAPPMPAAADSFVFGFSAGPGHHRHRHWGHGHRHHHHWQPRHYYGYHYAPPRVIYAPAPVYVPPPVVYAPPPLAAVPASPVYRDMSGRYCREYQATVTVNGMPQPSYGTACLEPDGSWRVVN